MMHHHMHHHAHRGGNAVEEVQDEIEEVEEDPPANFIEGEMQMPTSKMLKLRSALMALLECIDGEPVSEGVANKMLQSYAGREGELFSSLRKKHHDGTVPQVIVTPAVPAEMVIKAEMEKEARSNRVLLPPIDSGDTGSAARRDSYLAIAEALKKEENKEEPNNFGFEVIDEVGVDPKKKMMQKLSQGMLKLIDKLRFLVYELPLRFLLQILSVTNVMTLSRICIVVHTSKDILVMAALAPICFDFPRTFTASFLIAFLPYVIISVGMGRMFHYEFDKYTRHLLKLDPEEMSRKDDKWKYRVNFMLFPLCYMCFGILFFMVADLRIATEYLLDDLHRYRLLYWYQYLRIICGLTSPAQAFLSAHLLGVRFKPWWRNATVHTPIHCTSTVHTLYTAHTLYTVHSLCTPCALTVHSLYTHCALTVHSLYIHYTGTYHLHAV
jgi:hypothetical protein